MPMNSILTASVPESDPVLGLSFVKEFIRLCEDGFRMGFHERNGGNVSCWLTPLQVQQLPECEGSEPWKDMELAIPQLAGEYFLITASGSCFRNISWAPRDNLCILRLDSRGERYQVLWGLRKGGRPTSELESHLMNFAIRASQPGRQCHVMYHAHPESVISLSNLLPLDSGVITRALWSSMIECAFLFPYGVGVVECMIPGGAAIARKTAEMMRTHDAVLWAHHGLFCAGADFDSAFGLMEAIDKAARIQLRILSAGVPRRNNISPKVFHEIAEMLDGKMNMDYVMECGNDGAGE